MRIDDELAALSIERDSMLTIGVFDGVHRGHRRLLAHLVESARETGRAAGVVTFRNHPASVLRADFRPNYLTTLDQRIDLLRESGIDFVVPVTFDEHLSKLDARAFAERLVSALSMKGLVVGADFAMGHGRGGDPAALARLGEELGFTVQTVDLLADGPHAVKSTSIRRALAEGDVEAVASMLGRNFTCQGVVAHGEKRGRELGFPTANLETPPGLAVPADGIYAAWAHFDDLRRMAAVSIGVRPTFDGMPRAIEAYLLEYQGNLYGKTMRLEFVAFLREELRFGSVEALIVQMREDVLKASEILLHSSEVTN